MELTTKIEQKWQAATPKTHNIHIKNHVLVNHLLNAGKSSCIKCNRLFIKNVAMNNKEKQFTNGFNVKMKSHQLIRFKMHVYLQQPHQTFDIREKRNLRKGIRDQHE